MKFILSENPVVVDVIDELILDDDLGVLFVPNLQELFGIEDRENEGLLLLVTFLIVLFFFVVLVTALSLGLLLSLIGLNFFLVFFSELLLSFGELLLTAIFSLLLSRNLLVALITLLLDECLSADDVGLAVFDGSQQPAKQTTSNEAVFVNICLVDALDELLNVVYGLILFELTFLGSHRLIVLHFFEELIVDEQLSRFPEELLSALLDDFVPLIAEEVQESLHELAILDDFDVLELHQS